MDLERLEACLLCGSLELLTIDPEHCFCRCRQCGYIFDNPRPTTAEIVRFYSKPGQYASWMGEEAARDRMWQRRLRKLRRSGLSGSVLDVGAGIGQFLHHAKEFFLEVRGTEISAEAVRIARRKYGLSLMEADFDNVEFGRRFDVVTLFHVLEHVPDPRRTVTRCYDVLRPGGTLVIAVPNDVQSLKQRTRRLLGRLGNKRLQKLGPLALPQLKLDESGQEVHLSHFTAAVLKNLLETTGFTLIHAALDPYYARRGLSELRATLRYAVYNTLNALCKQNLYSTIWIAAQRPLTS